MSASATPPLLQCRPSPAASHPGAYLHPPKRKLRVAYSVGHMCETFPPNQREACDIPRASIKVGAENRLQNISRIVQWLKGTSSRVLLQEFPHLKKQYWGRHLWARGYFVVTCRSLWATPPA